MSAKPVKSMDFSNFLYFSVSTDNADYNYFTRFVKTKIGKKCHPVNRWKIGGIKKTEGHLY